MKPGAAAASAGAATILSLPVLVAGTGAGAEPDGSLVGTTVAPPPPPPVQETVPRAEYERVRRKSWRRLMGWRKAERQRERLKRAFRFRADFVSAGLRCIHELEGSWRDPNPPYWGGLQMDLGFQRTYGGPLFWRLGTANRWPAEAQVAVGVVAFYSGRGFGPWPNTRRGCGL